MNMNIEKKDAKYVKALEFVFINAKRNRVNNVMDQGFVITDYLSKNANNAEALHFVNKKLAIKNQAKSTGATV